jgi:hypothetical protein
MTWPPETKGATKAAPPVTEWRPAPWDDVTELPPLTTEPVAKAVMVAPAVRVCICGQQFREHWNGRPRRYCSTACRQRAYRRRRRSRSAQAASD